MLNTILIELQMTRLFVKPCVLVKGQWDLASRQETPMNGSYRRVTEHTQSHPFHELKSTAKTR